MFDDAQLNAALCAYFNGTAFQKIETVQSLWSGYGEIARFGAGSQTCIVKMVSLQPTQRHPKGWDNEDSHQRKLSSYVNEQHFYQYFAVYTSGASKVPNLFASGANEHCIWMLLEDLDGAGFSIRHGKVDTQQLTLGLTWLANFHACFLHDTYLTSSPNTSAENLPSWAPARQKVWPIGSYWHLGTRLQEWHAMAPSSLKNAAAKLDEHLNQARFQTLLHGDAKLANFCFHASENNVAAVDFQYVGFGSGVKDIIYYIGSCLDTAALEKQGDDALTQYLAQLKVALTKTHSHSINFDDLEREYRQLYCVAWADFERFLMGWSPSHTKLNHYSAAQTHKALQSVE